MSACSPRDRPQLLPFPDAFAPFPNCNFPKTVTAMRLALRLHSPRPQPPRSEHLPRRNNPASVWESGLPSVSQRLFVSPILSCARFAAVIKTNHAKKGCFFLLVRAVHDEERTRTHLRASAVVCHPGAPSFEACNWVMSYLNNCFWFFIRSVCLDAPSSLFKPFPVAVAKSLDCGVLANV